jgi:hypothetical protein
MTMSCKRFFGIFCLTKFCSGRILLCVPSPCSPSLNWYALFIAIFQRPLIERQNNRVYAITRCANRAAGRWCYSFPIFTPTPDPHSLRSVKWHPKEPDTLALASDTGIYLINIAEAQIHDAVHYSDLSRFIFSVPSVSTQGSGLNLSISLLITF